jgi:glyoxylase-like metal-dependent hydrolase (beta-lactamase superfamily II)
MEPQLFSADTYPKCPLLLADGVWLLGNYHFNLFYIRGERRSALVELGVTAVVDTVIAQLAALDTAPDYLVLTHPHADHMTGLPGLMDRYPRSRPGLWQGGKGVRHPSQGFGSDAQRRCLHFPSNGRGGFCPGAPPPGSL